MSLNLNKSGILQLTKRSHKQTEEVLIQGIPVVDRYKYLRILLNDKINLELHLSNLSLNEQIFMNGLKKLKISYVSVKYRIEIWQTYWKSPPITDFTREMQRIIAPGLSSWILNKWSRISTFIMPSSQQITTTHLKSTCTPDGTLFWYTLSAPSTSPLL